MRKQDKKLIFLLIALVIIIIILLNIFSTLVKTDDKEKNKSNFEDEELIIDYVKKGKYEPSVINSEYSALKPEEISAIDDVIDYVVEKINSKDYEKLYYMTEINYRNAKFEEIQDFQKYLDSAFKSNENKAVYYRISNKACYITLAFSSEKGEDYKEIKVNNYTSIDDAKIYFEDVDIVHEAVTHENISNILFNMKYIIEYSNKNTVIVELVNRNKKDSDIIIKNFELTTDINDGKLDSEYMETIKIAANERVRLEIPFEKQSKLYILPDYITFEYEINDKVTSVESMIKYEDLE